MTTQPAAMEGQQLYKNKNTTVSSVDRHFWSSGLRAHEPRGAHPAATRRLHIRCQQILEA